jgi:hypothetical protein
MRQRLWRLTTGSNCDCKNGSIIGVVPRAPAKPTPAEPEKPEPPDMEHIPRRIGWTAHGPHVIKTGTVVTTPDDREAIDWYDAYQAWKQAQQPAPKTTAAPETKAAVDPEPHLGDAPPSVTWASDGPKVLATGTAVTPPPTQEAIDWVEAYEAQQAQAATPEPEPVLAEPSTEAEADTFMAPPTPEPEAAVAEMAPEPEPVVAEVQQVQPESVEPAPAVTPPSPEPQPAAEVVVEPAPAPAAELPTAEATAPPVVVEELPTQIA